jgi:acyl-coenzyme A synthetase/AMP-(fatty) acid ligase
MDLPPDVIWSDEAFRELGLMPPARRVPIPGGPQDVASSMDDAVRTVPDGEAVVGRYRRYTYAQLEADVRSAVAVLKGLGVRPGDRVAASVGNHPEVVVAFMASRSRGRRSCRCCGTASPCC